MYAPVVARRSASDILLTRDSRAAPRPGVQHSRATLSRAASFPSPHAMRNVLAALLMSVSLACGGIGAALLAWPQDFLVLIGAAFLGSGSAGALLLVWVGGVAAVVAWRLSPQLGHRLGE